jgi:hypothetical protein
MSKLKTIQDTLRSNPNVVIIGDAFEKVFPPEKGIVNVINYIIAPKSGLYTVSELQSFMANLIPGLEPNYKQDFEQCRNSLRLGIMYFDEKIGEKKTSITENLSSAYDEDSNVKWLVTGENSHQTTEEYARRIWITLTPNKALGYDFLANKFNSGSWLKLEDIAKYRKAEEADKKGLNPA